MVKLDILSGPSNADGAEQWLGVSEKTIGLNKH